MGADERNAEAMIWKNWLLLGFNTLTAAQLQKRIHKQSWIIGGLTLLLLVLLAFAQPIDLYFARKPEGRTLQMVGLTMPNMTNRAVLAWTTTAVTDIMTLGFGDVDQKFATQRKYFTSEGWESYTEVFSKMRIAQIIKESQLVRTTVPSNVPVIVDQGVGSDEIYQWVVQMPIITTDATNNNKTAQSPSIVTLFVVRVPVEENPFGIAIRQWMQ